MTNIMGKKSRKRWTLSGQLVAVFGEGVRDSISEGTIFDTYRDQDEDLGGCGVARAE